VRVKQQSNAPWFGPSVNGLQGTVLEGAERCQVDTEEVVRGKSGNPEEPCLLMDGISPHRILHLNKVPWKFIAHWGWRALV